MLFGRTPMENSDLGRMEGSKARPDGREAVHGGVHLELLYLIAHLDLMTKHSRASSGQFHFQFHV